jgi:hypothetical protein
MPMKTLVPLILLVLAGCQATPASILATPPVVVTSTTPQAPVPPDAALERKIHQQAQYIEALVSQNEALSMRLNSGAEPPPYPSPVVRALAKPLAVQAAATEAAQEPKPAEAPTLTPNADGVIDVAAALVVPKSGETVNPFAVRAVPGEMVREVSLQVGGIVAGPAACAVINDRLVQAGDSIESLAVERIEADAVILKHGAQRLRLPIGGKTLRVRLPI